MDAGLPITACLEDANVGRDIEAATQALLGKLRSDAAPAALRRLIRDDLGIEWDGVRLRSLWLVTHRGLRRAGVREHPASLAVLVGWRGAGLAQVRAPGARRTVSLA